MSGSPYNLVQVPLIEAVIEVRFAGDARIEVARGEFQEAVRSDFPDLLVPQIGTGEFPALAPYRFQSSDGTRTLALSINSLAYMTQQYPGWEAFSSEYMKYWAELVSRVTPRSLTRVGTRFVNRFDEALLKEVDLTDAPAYLALLTRDDCNFHRSVTNFTRNSISLLVNVERPENEDALVLDYDAYTQSMTLERLVETLNALHGRAEEEFLRVLKPEYRLMLSAPKVGG